MNAPTQIIEQQAGQELQVASTTQLILDPNAMKAMMDLATFMAKGTLTLPEAYRNNPANCLAVVMQAIQWKMNPFAIAQKTHFVNGNIGYESQLVAAVINASGATQGNFKFEYFGPWENVIGKFEIKTSTKENKTSEYRIPGWKLADEEGIGVRVIATLKGETEPRVLELLLAQARTRNSTLWADDPKQQLTYLAQKKWARLYAPGVILGVYSSDELEEPQPERDVTPQPAQEKEPVYYTNDEFGEKKSAWKEIVLTGKKTGSDLITFVESKGKLLTEAQKTEINTWKVIEQAPVNDPFVTDMQNAEQQGEQ